MKQKLSYLILFLIPIYLNSAANCSIVHVGSNDTAKLQASYSEESEVLAEIPPAEKNLELTWKTQLVAEQYWIEVRYQGKTGWLKRELITREDLKLTLEQEKLVDSILFNFTKAVQLKQAEYVIEDIYFLRGFYVYDNKGNKLYFCPHAQINQLWNYALKDEKTKLKYRYLKPLFENINLFLQEEFSIAFISDDITQLPAEIENFNRIMLINDQQKILVGFEFWNNEPYLTYIAYLE
jgi:hypothetical protein